MRKAAIFSPAHHRRKLSREFRFSARPEAHSQAIAAIRVSLLFQLSLYLASHCSRSSRNCSAPPAEFRQLPRDPEQLHGAPDRFFAPSIDPGIQRPKATASDADRRSATESSPASSSRSADSSARERTHARVSWCLSQSSKPPCFHSLRFCSLIGRPPNSSERLLYFRHIVQPRHQALARFAVAQPAVQQIADRTGQPGDFSVARHISSVPADRC